MAVTSTIPTQFHEITPEWLTAVLCEKHPGAVVTAVEVKLASAGTHERHRLLPTYNEAGRQAGLPGSIFTSWSTSTAVGGWRKTTRNTL